MRPLPPPGRRLRRQNAVLIPVDENGIVAHGSVEDMPRPPPVAVRISRQDAVYLDMNGHALPAGETTTAAAQFPQAALQTPSRAGPSRATDAGLPLPMKIRALGTPKPELHDLFARRSRGPMVPQPSSPQGGQPGVRFEPAEEGSGEPKEPKKPEEPKEPEDPLMTELKKLHTENRTQALAWKKWHKVSKVLSANAKGKKRARAPEDEQAEVDNRPQYKRICTADVREYYTEFAGLLTVRMSVIPLPDYLRDGDEVRVGKREHCDAWEKKRSRDEFEKDKDAAAEDSDERAAKKARVEPEVTTEG
ncbi:hypothetical protein VTO73DRAFT_4127 [Trametes versicolor]